MANHPSALKRARQAKKRQARNRAALSTLRTTLKKFSLTLASEKTDSIKGDLKKATAILAKSASKGIIPKQRAARKTSRLTRKANRVSAPTTS